MKYKGSWAQGFASTFNPTAGINLGLQWKEKKKAQQKIDDAMEQLKINSTQLASKFDAARADGSITQQEYGDAMAWAIPLGKEIMGKTNDLYANYQNMTPEQLQTELDNIDAVYKFSKDLDFQNLDEMKAFGSKLTQPNAKMQWDLIIKSIENRGKPVQQQSFATPEEVTAAYPGSGYKWSDDAKGYVPTYQKPTKADQPPTELDQMEVTKKFLDSAYATGNANYFNKIAKERGIPTTFETYKQGYQEPEPDGGKTKAFDLNDFVFGSDGIMKDYGTGGGRLAPEDIEAIKNNYNIKKNLLSKENQKSVEEFLFQSGIDVNAQVQEEPIPEPQAQQPGPLQKGINAVKGWLGQKGTQKQTDYATMTVEVLFKLADEEDDQMAYEELKKRGLIK